jgi:hypothetical protein
MKFVGVQQQENNFIDELMYELKKKFYSWVILPWRKKKRLILKLLPQLT